MTEQTPAPAPALSGQANPTATPAPSAGLIPAVSFAPDVVMAAREAKAFARATEAVNLRHAKEAVTQLKANQGYEAGNIQRVLRAHVSTLSESEKEKLYQADATGRVPLNNVNELERLVDKVTSEVVPKKLIEEHGDEKSAIEAMMRDRTSQYWKGPKSEATQLRYRDLMRE